MVTFVFDSSAALRYLDDKAGAARVEQILRDHALGIVRLHISAIQWGEIARIVCRRHGASIVSQVLFKLRSLGFEVVPVDADQAVRAALCKMP